MSFPTGTAGFSPRALAGLAALFLGTVAAAWAWFHVGIRPAEGLRFNVRREIPGWDFEAVAIPPRAQELLASTNLFNGIFAGPAGERVTVFAGEWHASDARQLSVVQHTPDICWVAVGMRPGDLGQPDKAAVEIGGQALPFECRVFQGAGGAQPTLVLWLTLVSGRVMEEGARWRSEEQVEEFDRERRLFTSRRIASGHFLANLRDRQPATGDKQFVRLSIETGPDWQHSLEKLRDFAARWLHLERLDPRPA